MGHEREPMKPEISTYSIANQQTEQGTEAVKVEVERLARLLERTQQLDRWSTVPNLSPLEKVRLAGVGWTVAHGGLS